MNDATRASAEGTEPSLSMLVDNSIHSPAPTLRGRPPRRILWVLIAAALALHLFFLDGLGSGAPHGRVVMAPALEVRSVPAVAPMPTPAVESSPAVLAQAAASPLPKPTRAQSPARRPEASTRATVPSDVSPPALKAADAVSINPTTQAAPAASQTPIAPPAAGDVPVYRTQLPPSMRLQYALRRGAATGSAELTWRMAEGAYQLSLEARLSERVLFAQISQGRIDQDGVAPLRFTNQRARGGVQAANFQRQNDTSEGKVTFSGPTTEYPLLPGTQDRLSWLVQLSAVAAAEPESSAPGGQVVLYVVTARGEADVWTLRFVDFEVVETPAGPVRAAKFSRNARRLYDTQVDVWLDPARHHLPVKARWGTSPDGDALELQLQSVQSLQAL
jgi:Protein of unknown function (DUF3108)